MESVPCILYDDTFEMVTKKYLNLRDLFCLKLSNKLHYYNIDIRFELRKYIDCLLDKIFGNQKDIIKDELIKSNSFILDQNMYQLLYNNVIELKPMVAINKTFNLNLINYNRPIHFSKSSVFQNLTIDSILINSENILLYQYDLPDLISQYEIYGKFAVKRNNFGILINMLKIYEKNQ